MATFRAICIFCEDIREEKSGQDIIVGTLPDILKIEGAAPPNPGATANIPKMGFYLRAHFDVQDDPPKSVSARIENNAGLVMGQGEWKPEELRKAFEAAHQNHLPFAGILLKMVIAPVPIAAPGGNLTVFLTVDGAEHVVGALNITLPTASEQPASQSPPAA